jgi:hypothetical protein
MNPETDELRYSQSFIKVIANATLDNIEMDPDDRDRLRNPPHEVLPPDVDQLLSLGYWVDTRNSPDSVYEDVIKRTQSEAQNSGRDLLSLYRVEQLVKDLTGVCGLKTDMCPKSCAAYVGMFAESQVCPYCGGPRYSGDPAKKKALRQFITIPIGPILQTLYRYTGNCELLSYRKRATAQMRTQVDQHGIIEQWNDYIDGTMYQEYLLRGQIQDTDILLSFSIDAAQLVKSADSTNCWVYSWTLLELSPEHRFKKRWSFPGGFIPGSPKNTDSFLVPGFSHLNAFMKEGLQVWHADSGLQLARHPFVYFNTADAKGLATVNGTNGPLAAHGCRLLCPQDCRRRENDGHYFPACLRATGPVLEGSDHDDIDPAQIAHTSCSPTEYQGRVRALYQARTQADFEDARRKGGITKRSIIEGLRHRSHMPDCLTVDTMHVFGLNITELLVMLLRGHRKKATRFDDSKTWDFTALKDSELWKQLGKLIALARRYLPNSFGRPPRNLAEKINSGYKSWEFMIVFWGYFPGMLHEILPDWQYRNFCKLVFAVRRYCAYTVPSPKFLKEAYEAGVEFYCEYEERYYQRKPERLDLCRQALHSVMHMPREVTRTGPLPLTAQWAHERLIGRDPAVRSGPVFRHFAKTEDQTKRSGPVLEHCGDRTTQRPRPRSGPGL